VTKNKFYILSDIRVDDPLSEYCSIKKIDLNFIPEGLDVPVVDVIASRIFQKEKPILILDMSNDNFRKLFTENSKYQNFESVSKKCELIFYSKSDLLLYLDGIHKKEKDLASWINHLRPKIITDSKAGVFFKENYPDCEFIDHYDMFWYGNCYPHLSTLKKHRPDLDFLFIVAKKESRPLRNILYDKMESNNLLEKSISSFKPKNDRIYDDLVIDYSDYFIKSHRWKDSLPMISYYDRTNFELVAETYAIENFDDTFTLTEKTIKPITMLHPFMVFGSHNHLKNMRSMGFRTFGEHIDESYDSEPDVEKRADLIIENLKILKGSSDRFYKDTKDIREHNLLVLQHGIGEWKTKLWTRFDEFFKNIG